jgi:hypothetical protein
MMEPFGAHLRKFLIVRRPFIPIALSMAAYQQHEANKAAMAGIDQGLDNLVAQTGQINTGAKAIGQELSEQIEIIKDTKERMDVTDSKINKATDKLVDIQATGGSALVSWICMGVLILLILVVVILPSSLFK